MKKIPLRTFQLPPDAEQRAGSFSIRQLGGLTGGKELEQGLHRHDYYFILLVQKGKGVHSIDFKTYQVKKGSLFIIRPGSVHQLSLARGSAGYVLQFNPDFYFTRHQAGTLLRALHHLSHCSLSPAGLSRLGLLFADLYRENSERREAYAEAIKARLDLLFIELKRLCPGTVAAETAGWSFARQKYLELSELLETGILRYKKVSDYARLLGLSTHQLNAITRKAAGKSCAALISAQVLLEAKRCLLATTSQVSQIAYHLGYEDVSYFIRFFKKQTGHTPEAFRRLHK